jgi:hypothetical protein
VPRGQRNVVYEESSGEEGEEDEVSETVYVDAPGRIEGPIFHPILDIGVYIPGDEIVIIQRPDDTNDGGWGGGPASDDDVIIDVPQHCLDAGCPMSFKCGESSFGGEWTCTLTGCGQLECPTCVVIVGNLKCAYICTQEGGYVTGPGFFQKNMTGEKTFCPDGSFTHVDPLTGLIRKAIGGILPGW